MEDDKNRKKDAMTNKEAKPTESKSVETKPKDDQAAKVKTSVMKLKDYEVE
jgi:hypothetical protein